MKNFLPTYQNALVFVLILATSPAFPQEMKTNGNKNGNADGYYIDFPFDVAYKNPEEKLPSSFVGHRIRRVVDALNKIPRQKDQYETTAHFEERQHSALQKPLFGQVYYTSPIFIITKLFSTSYNADKGELSMWVSFKRETDSGPPSIQRELKGDFGIGITNHKNLPLSQKTADNKYIFKGVVKVPPQRAKEIRKNLAVGFSGKLSSSIPQSFPEFQGGGYYVSPVSGEYLPLSRDIYFVNMDVSEIVFYDYQTGYRYHRVKAENLKSDAPSNVK